MATDSWPTKSLSVIKLQLDEKNPRLGRDKSALTPREIIQYLFQHDKAIEIAQSIASRGYFPNEPLLAIQEDGAYVIVEGNRRLAALKVLREPTLLEGPLGAQVSRLSQKIPDLRDIANVPVTVAPNRRATDRQIAGRHRGTPVLAWRAENRASFILDKLDEGYDNYQLGAELGFSLPDIQKARQTRSIAEMARSLDLPKEVRAKVDNPRARLFTTIERVFDSPVGRAYLRVEPSAEHGIRGTTTKGEFLRGFKRLVLDVALGRESSRTLNASKDIRRYFNSLPASERPAAKRGSFVPEDVTKGGPARPEAEQDEPTAPVKKQMRVSKTVLPRDFAVRFGNDRLVDMRGELTKLKREDFPNAGAVLLRVFFELAVTDYLQRTGDLDQVIERLGGSDNLPYGTPKMKELVPALLRIVKKRLPKQQANAVEKAIRYDHSAPFTISDLHGFVHHSDLPTDRDIQQFWLRTQPLFRMMLEQDIEDAAIPTR
jgi:hypothetical protein